MKKLLFLALMAFSIVSCDKDDDTEDVTPNEPTPIEPVVNNYSGSASYGDLVTFAINKDDQSYELVNETTQRTETGNYTVKDGDLAGVYEVEANGSKFYGVELDDKIVVANFPSGNANNDLSFGVTSEIDNSSNLDVIAGNYVYVKLGSYLSSSPMEWGQFTLTSTEISLTYFDAGEYIEDEALQYPISSQADVTGTWAINGTKNDRIDVEIGGQSYTGYVYAAGNTAVFLIDLGDGEGSIIAYKAGSRSISSFAGDYKYVDFWQDGSKGAGNYTIGTDGSVSYSYSDGTSNEQLNNNLTPANSNIGNIYASYDYDGEGSNLYIVVTGDVIMHFSFDVNDEFDGYGAGAKI